MLEKATQNWWFAEHKGKTGYFPARYALPLNLQQSVYQVTRPFHDNSGDVEIHLLIDQVRIYSLTLNEYLFDGEVSHAVQIKFSC